MGYHEFLRGKSQLAGMDGFAPLSMPDFLFDFQQALTEWAIRKGRSAVFADCGLGKTACQLVWADNVRRKTNKPVLIVTPLAVSAQTCEEGEKFGIEARVSREGAVHPGITVTNYERLHYFDADKFGGVVCDESSAIKAFDGKRRKQVTRFLSKHRYRLLCTATAAPNDYIELGTSSEALGEMTQSEMLDTFFRSSDKKRHSLFKEGDFWNRAKYFFRAHSEQPFWRWVCSWSRAIRKPSDLGFDDTRFVLPELIVNQHVVPTTFRFPGELFVRIAATLAEQREERKRTIRERCDMVRQLVDHSEPAVVWCQYNEEGDILEKIIPSAVQVAGCTPEEEKEKHFLDFTHGRSRVLVTKPKIGAWGLNWQHCGHQVFFPSHCYDEITEVLTDRGWLSFEGVTIADKVATVNTETEAFEWQHPTEVIWNPYRGDMIQFRGDGKFQCSFDLLVTPNHRMVVKRHPTSGNQLEFIEAEILQSKNLMHEYSMLSCASVLSESDPPYVEIPASQLNPKRVPYCGLIGCVTVPNGTVIVRRNGIPVVSGNSHEQWYQAVRRSLRFGRVGPVRVDIVATEGEAGVTENLKAKQVKADAMFTALVAEMNNAMKVELADIYTQKAEVPAWL